VISAIKMDKYNTIINFDLKPDLIITALPNSLHYRLNMNICKGTKDFGMNWGI